MPLGIRDGMSGAIWSKPFYPTENEYQFAVETVEHAPGLVAVCTKEDHLWKPGTK